MSKERNNKLLKMVDKYIGIPLVYSLGMFHKKKKLPVDINYIGVLATAAIGDTIIMSSAINDIKNKYPNSHIVLFCGSSNYEVAKLLQNIDKIEKLPIKNIIKSKKIIQSYKFDIWVDFGPWPRLNSLLTYLSNAKYKIGFFTQKQYRHYIYDNYVIHSDDIHEYKNYCNLIKLFNITKFTLPNIILNSISENKKEYIVCHMFAGGSKANLKELLLEQWYYIITYLQNLDYNIYLTGAPADFERIDEFINKYNLDINNMAGKLSLKETAVLIKEAKLTISIDTGIMHLASALKVSLVAIHGPTSPERWGSLSKNTISIYLNKNCAPCISLGFESNCNNNICIKEITQDMINTTIDKALKGL